ncbi:hypothetical protein ECE18_17120 [Acinetobacter baumannii]|nr:hypothetical protein [Acinetobacter baumannii]
MVIGEQLLPFIKSYF